MTADLPPAGPRTAHDASTVDVSVVVPVYNPGRYLKPCVKSLLAQSLPNDRYEVILIDDGSTDESPAYLDELAAEHPSRIRVVHQPNSGWPGKPRNVGTDMARGEYVFYSDHDDVMAPEALERLLALARKNHSDVVIPKLINRGRPVPLKVVRETIDHIVLGRDPVEGSMTPHKMFRRQFLVDKNIRWVEGKIRLEDEMFVMEAYVRADVISVLGDYAAYARIRRHDRGNAAMGDWEPADYFSYVTRVFEIVSTYVEPGPVRDYLLLRECDRKMLGKLYGTAFLRRTGVEQQALVTEARRVMNDRLASSLFDALPPISRAVAQAVLADRVDLLKRLSRMVGRVRATATYQHLQCSADRVSLAVTGELTLADGEPIAVIPEGDRWRVGPRLIPAGIAVGTFDRDEIMKATLDVTVRHLGSRVEWIVPGTVAPSLEAVPGSADGAHRIVFRGAVEFDPATIAGGGPLRPGIWRVYGRIGALGVGRTSELRPEARLPRLQARVSSLSPALGAALTLGQRKQLVLVIDASAHARRAMALRSAPLVKSARRALRRTSRRVSRLAR